MLCHNIRKYVYKGKMSDDEYTMLRLKVRNLPASPRTFGPPRPSTAIHGLPRPSTAIHGLPKPSTAFHSLLSSSLLDRLHRSSVRAPSSPPSG